MTAAHTWQFKARFRKGAFGWRTEPARSRVIEAVREIRSVARKCRTHHGRSVHAKRPGPRGLGFHPLGHSTESAASKNRSILSLLLKHVGNPGVVTAVI
jgi:hypothetical protein